METHGTYLALGYLLLGLISSLVFRAVRDALPHDPVAQERIVGASLTALALADVRARTYVSSCALTTHITALYRLLSVYFSFPICCWY